MMVILINPKDLKKMFPLSLAGKTVFLDIEVVDAPLDYNIILGRSYMYSMKAVASSIFDTMMFPHNGKIVSLDQLTYYDPKPQTNLDNVFPTLGRSQPIPSSTGVGPDVFKDSTLLGTYHGPPPQVSSLGTFLFVPLHILINHWPHCLPHRVCHPLSRRESPLLPCLLCHHWERTHVQGLPLHRSISFFSHHLVWLGPL